jgi:RTX calcium-binding nonapeptide repeat (4 copies)
MHRRLLLAALVAAAVVVGPSAAQAATLEPYDGIRQTMLLTGAPDEVNLVSVTDKKGGVVVIEDINMPLQLGDARNCVALDERTVSCMNVKRVALDLNDGPDVATLATSREVWLNGGHGNDRYNAIGTSKPSEVDFDGGFGIDTASYFHATEGVNVGVDGFPFDGRPGDNDRIDREVEIVHGSQHADILTGTQRAQQLFGGEGDDVISGGPAEDVLNGGRGDDRIDARDGELDTIDCGGRPFVDQLLADPVEASIVGCAI